MNRRNEFDDPDINQAIGNIFSILNPRHYMPSNNPVFTFALVIVTIGIFASVIWYSYPKEKVLQDDLAVPVIKADNKPLRIKPEDEGGMDILFEDSTVFDTIASGASGASGDNGERKIENLLSDNEEPLSRSALFAGLKTDLNSELSQATEKDGQDRAEMSTNTHSSTIAAVPDKPHSAAVKPQGKLQEKTIKAVPAIAPEQANIIKPETKPTVTANVKPDAKKTTTSPATAQKKYYVQLGSLTSQSDADKAWASYSKKYSTALSGAEHRIEKAIIKDRGTYYRVQAGPFPEDKARSICNTIKNKYSGGCIVIKA